MSWKSIDLQVALPRTQDAGKIQEQMTKQSEHFQESLAQSQLEQEKQKRKTVNEMEETIKAEINKDQEKHKEQGNNKEDTSEEKEQEMKHPYLGSNIDFSG